MFRTFVILLVVIVGSIYGASTASGGSSATTKGTPTATPSRGTPATATGTRPTQRTTTTSPFLRCYACGGLNAPCPDPFPSNGAGVAETIVRRPAYCANVIPGKSATNRPVRRVALASECTYNGCRSVGGDTTLCCCNRDYCNTGLLTSKVTFSLMIVALAFLAFFR